MNKMAALVARMFRRAETPNAVVSALFTHAIGRPLMVHPQIGEQLIHGYLSGAVDSPEPLMAVDEPISAGREKKRYVAVLNIAGPLVDRPQPGLCDDGPLSYEAIREAFDRCMADDAVTGIVMRMRTPGGMVDGCFDLTDHINANRGKGKPIHAVVDNMAYSAGYAIAAACDEIWVSRTGGVGSVGVYGYHLDQTEFNAKMGVKISLIYAGDHKVEFSPHVQLSDEARAREQGVVDEMYALFTQSVATYRGMKLDAVVATQAATFNGQAAVDAGFATKLGTMRDALAAMSESDAQRAEREASEARARADADRAQAAQVVVAAGVKADIVAALLEPDSGITAETVAARLEHAQAVVDLCVAAGDRSLAKDYIVQNTNIEVVRKQLLDVKAQDGPEVVTTIPAKSSAMAPPTSESIYESRRRAASASTSV